ncbi:MAG: M1 family peptidase [Chloroflexi bacterium]|nr:MAG: M1 family peptidase [Chloroflexota bacterium]
MSKYVILLLSATVLFGIVNSQSPQPGAAGAGDTLFPSLGNGGYDVQHYTIDLNVDVKTNTITGTTTIEAVALQDLRTFNFDLVGLTVDAITVNAAAAAFERDDLELIITPETPLTTGDTFITQVMYGGIPDASPIRILPNLAGWQTYGTGTIVAGEPLSASTVFPVNEHPSDKATYTFRVTVPEGLVVASNGVLTEEIDNGATTTFVWQMRDPMASYLTTIGIGKFEIVTIEGPGGLPIINYFDNTLPDDLPERFVVTAEMIEFFAERFGPYPFESYGAIVVNAPLGFALETQTRSLFGSSVAVMNDIVLQAFLAHELAHQWFGDSVSLIDWGDIWLNEGFATYAHNLWLEHRFGIDTWAANYEQISQLAPPGIATAEDLFADAVYDRGSLALRALQARVGDDIFFEIIRTYLERFRHGNATTADFIAVAEEVSKQDLSAFFAGWLFDTTTPSIPELGLGAA